MPRKVVVPLQHAASHPVAAPQRGAHQDSHARQVAPHRHGVRDQAYTVCGRRMAHRKWKETKQQSGTAGPGNMFGCCLVSFHFLWAILWPHLVQGGPSGPGQPFADT